MNHTNVSVTGRLKACCVVRLRTAAIGLAVLAMIGAPARANSTADTMYQPAGLTPGGVLASPTITSVGTVGTNSTVSWYGMRGWYTVLMSTNSGTSYSPVGGSVAAANYAWSNTVNNGGSPFALVWLVQTNYYVGSGGCSGCHGDHYTPWLGTLHASAYSLLITNESAQGGSLVYSTVGYGQAGYSNRVTTPYLQNVGCENCHGPAGWHKNSDHELIRPAVTIASEVCGGCHSTASLPTYNEWATSPHAVLPSNFTNGSKAFNNAVNGQGRMITCGPCHSGATRLAMVMDYQSRQAGITNLLTLPSGQDAAAYGQTCAVCHDPHSPTFVSTNVVYTTNVLAWTNVASDYGIYHTNVYYTTNVTSATSVVKVPHQLRYPMNSTNFFTFFTSAATNITYYTNLTYHNGSSGTNYWTNVVTAVTNYGNDGFLSQYNPNIQVCGQCHNTRGARWDGVGQIWSGTNFVASTPSWSSAPHNSPQYNILIGILQPDYLNSTNGKTVWTNSVLTNGIGIYATHSGAPGGRSLNTNQCSTCHVPIYTDKYGTFKTGHSFALDINGCALGGCHTSGAPNYRATQVSTTNQINGIVALLRAWATSQGPVLFPSTYQNYGQNAWEYTTPGALGDGSTNQGPSAADQPLLPTAIMQARYDLYMVNNDGSKGVHNPTFIPILLSDAKAKVLGQINGITANYPTMFQASTSVVFTNTLVNFTNMTPGLGTRVTNSVWNFGNGTITNNNTVVSTYYTVPGAYTVSLTTTDTNGNTGNMTISGYINVYNKPVPNFTYTPGPYTFPVTVSFTNTSSFADYFVWVYMNGVSSALNSLSSNAPPFTYTNAGIYQVKLTAYNEAGSVAITNTISVGPYAGFVANTTLGAAPLTAVFTSTGAGVINYNWSFGDGQTSTLANPTNVYAGNGTNTVTLTVDNGVLTNTLVKTNYIIVASPVAAFTANKTTGAGPLTVTFTNLSTFASSYKWTFGVGSLGSTSTSPTFTYTNNAGSPYTVTLQAINTGATNTVTKTGYIIVN